LNGKVLTTVIALLDVPDRDLAVIDTTTFGVNYTTGLMNLCMDVSVNRAPTRS
jgi:hypothetical protein